MEATFKLTKQAAFLTTLILLLGGLAGCGRLGGTSSASKQKLVIDYAAFNIDDLTTGRDAATQAATGLTGDDEGVMYAWRGVFTNLIAAKEAMQQAAKILDDEDILNINTITNGSQRHVSQQFIDRRGMANDYDTAINAWDHALSTLEGTYVMELHKFQVSPDRANAEWGNFSKILGDQIHHGPLHERIDVQRKICAIDHKIAMQYNYAVGSMETYYSRIQALMPRPRPGYVNPPVQQLKNNPILTDAREDFQDMIAKIEKLKQEELQLLQPAKPEK